MKGVYLVLAVTEIILLFAAIFVLAFTRHEAYQDFLLMTLLIDITANSWIHKKSKGTDQKDD